MLVRFNFGPNAGSTSHVPRDQFIDILIRAGVLELAEELQPTRIPAPLPGLKQFPEVKWRIGQTLVGAEYYIAATDGRTELVYNGDPDKAALHKFWLLGQAHIAPPEVIAEYKRLKNGPDAESILEMQRLKRIELEEKMR